MDINTLKDLSIARGEYPFGFTKKTSCKITKKNYLRLCLDNFSYKYLSYRFMN